MGRWLITQIIFVTVLLYNQDVTGGGGAVQRFDGWFNNLAFPSWGSVGEPLMQNITTAYEDYTYKPVCTDRPSARLVSSVFRSNLSESLGGSYHNRSALFAFFGQLVMFEMTDTDDMTCPVEMLKIPVPRCDTDFDPGCSGTKHMPYQRITYDKETGQSPNSPRRQVNGATSYIDASFVYGTSRVRTSFLRQMNSGYLASGDVWKKFPEKNDIELPYVSFPTASHTDQHQEHLWNPILDCAYMYLEIVCAKCQLRNNLKILGHVMIVELGDPHVHENPALLSLGVLFFRWHNYLAKKFNTDHPEWSPGEVFYKSRRWVMASLQNIIFYEWLPKLLNTEVDPYKGYNSNLEPGVSAVFDAAAIKYIMTLIPTGISQRTGSCEAVVHGRQKALRLCNSYFRSQDILITREDGVEETLMGLASQLAEKEDLFVVEDLQSKYYGPLHYSRHDYVSQTIMRGRDYGLPDYNTVRKQMGLKTFSNWSDINPMLYQQHPEVFDTFMKHYNTVDHLDVFVGGMLETTNNGPGELFRRIILDQFYRIRDGDRFWFENDQNDILTKDEIKQIKAIKLYDVIVNSTKIDADEIQNDVFTAVYANCNTVYLKEEDLEECYEHKSYDYFAGSEIPFIIIWISFGLIPFLCVLVAYIAAKCRQWRHTKDVRKKQTFIHSSESNTRTLRSQFSDSVSDHQAYEWLGFNEDPRPVIVKVKTKCQIGLTSMKGTSLRTINLEKFEVIEAWLSTNKGRTVVMIKIPKEYDLVLQFSNFNERTEFINSFEKAISFNNRTLDIQDDKLKAIQNNAFTQKKRNAVLEKFFKTVFSEAFQMDYDPDLENNEENSIKTKDIMEIQLTKEEFAQAMAVKQNSDFVENMFDLLDSDHDGCITFREFLNAVVLFSKGTAQEKLELVFRMFAAEQNGSLQKEELTKMFGSLLDMANCNIDKQDVNNLVESMCSQCGLEDKPVFNFEEFCQILSPQMDKIWNAGIEWKGRKSCYPERKKSKHWFGSKAKKPFYSMDEGNDGGRRKSSIEGSRRNSNVSYDNGRKHSFAGTPDQNDIGRRMSSPALMLNNGIETLTRFVADREKYSPIKAKMKTLAHWVENNRQHIFYLVLFFGIVIGLFAERFYYYTVEREHSGLRTLMSYGISVTRGAAAGMSFTFSLLMLTMCRNVITWLRGSFINNYIPFDSHIAFHKIVAWVALFFTALHVLGYGFNFYHIVTQPTNHLCIFDSIVLRAESRLSFTFWVFGNMTGFTGVLLVLIICIIYVFATQTARRYIFNSFWLTHKLFILMYILTILHGASVIVQKPLFHVYFLVPAILFTIDKMISLSRKKTEITVIRAEKLPSDITFLEFKRPAKFEYKSGQWVSISCLSHAKNEYHPFTLTSAPHEDTLSLHIRALGPWTWNIRNIFDPENLKDGPYPKLYLDGPYGAGQQDWYQYEVSVLVGAGIGVTPYASILKNFVHMATMRTTYKMKCQKLYFIWVTGSQKHFEWLLDIIREVEEVDQKGIVSIDIFITQFFQNFDLRTAMLYVCEEHFQKLSGGRSVFTGLKANTHFGRPKLNEMLQTVHRVHPMVRKVGVFSCGPPGITKSVEQACIESSNTTKSLFEHHFENF